MPPEFHDGCYCFRGDEVESARALGLPIRCGGGLPCACSGYPLLDDLLELGKRPRSQCSCPCAAMHAAELAAKQRRCCGGNCKCPPGECRCPQQAVPGAFACVAEDEIRDGGVMGLSLGDISTDGLQTQTNGGCCGQRSSRENAQESNKSCCGGSAQRGALQNTTTVANVANANARSGSCCGGQAASTVALLPPAPSLAHIGGGEALTEGAEAGGRNGANEDGAIGIQEGLNGFIQTETIPQTQGVVPQIAEQAGCETQAVGTLQNGQVFDTQQLPQRPTSSAFGTQYVSQMLPTSSYETQAVLQPTSQPQALAEQAFAQTTDGSIGTPLQGTEFTNGYSIATAAVMAAAAYTAASAQPAEVTNASYNGTSVEKVEDFEVDNGLILMQSPTRSEEQSDPAQYNGAIVSTEQPSSDEAKPARSPQRRSRAREGNEGRERSFACPQCTSTFYFKQNRDRHVNEVHLGRRPHKCEYPGCGGAFKNRSGLKQHQRTVHEKARPFKCELCDSAFGQRNHLTQHVLVVHNKVKMFECAECGMCFSNVGNRTQHIKRKHSTKA